MGELDKDLCLFWKRVADAHISFPTSSIITFEFLEGQLEAHIGKPHLTIKFNTNLAFFFPFYFGIPLLTYVLLVLSLYKHACIFCFCFNCSPILCLVLITCWEKVNWLN